MSQWMVHHHGQETKEDTFERIQPEPSQGEEKFGLDSRREVSKRLYGRAKRTEELEPKASQEEDDPVRKQYLKERDEEMLR